LFSILTKGIDDTVAVTHGKLVGEYVASRWIANRTNDGHPPGSQPVVNGTSCGQYMYNLTFHTGLPFSSGYYNVKPFGVSSFNSSISPGNLFYVPPPPTIGSSEQVAEWNELYGYGAANPAHNTRTNNTDTVAMFHDGFFGSSTQFASDVFMGDNIPGGIDGLDALRIIAVAAMSSHDAHAIHWQWKYTYRRWRPIAAYRLADLCSSPDVNSLDDNAWNPVLVTGQNPEYPSGHSSRTGGFVGVFKRLLYNNLAFSTLSFGLPGVERSYSSFSAFEAEVDNARVWGGIHWRSAVVQGNTLGNRVAADYVSRLMRPRDD
jgi:membrane-associated phospholipid phosphatase